MLQFLFCLLFVFLFISFVVGLQKQGPLYVCELCQKHGKAVGSISSIEESKSRVTSLPTELTIVSTGPLSSPQLPCRHGKVCILYHYKLCFQADLEKLSNNAAYCLLVVIATCKNVFVNLIFQLLFIFEFQLIFNSLYTDQQLKQ